MLPHRAIVKGRRAYHLSDERGGVIIFHNSSPPGFLAMWEEVALCRTSEEFGKHFNLTDQEEWVALAYFFRDLENDADMVNMDT